MDYLKLLPNTPPRGMGKKVEALARWRQIIGYYYAKDKRGHLIADKAECWCSTCGSTFAAEMRPGETPGAYPKISFCRGLYSYGSPMACPVCGVTAKLEYKKRLTQHPVKSKNYPWTVKRAQGCAIFINWQAEVSIGWKSYGIDLTPRNAYIITPAGKILRATTGERWGWSQMAPVVYGCGWHMAYKNDIADDGMGLLFGMRPGLFEGTALENAKLETIMAKHVTQEIMAYTRLYLRHPNVENLVMTCPNITRQLLRQFESSMGPGGKLANLSWMNWKAAKPHEMLRMEKDAMHRLESSSPRQIAAALALQEATGAGYHIGDRGRALRSLEALGETWALQSLVRGGALKELPQPFDRAAEYMAANVTGGSSADVVARDVLDYWRDAKKAGFDLTNTTVAFPRDLNEAQARATDAITYTEHRERQQQFEKWAKAMAPLEWHWRGLFIRVATGPGELVREGKELQHCVGGYSSDHCRGNCIFFIRHEDAPEKSYFTLQLNTKTGKVIQNRGLRNCERTDEVHAFEDTWLRSVVQPWLNKKQKRTNRQAETTCAA